MPDLDIVTEFCKTQSEELYSADTRKRKSVLLQIKDDMDYNFGIHKAFRVLGLTQEQEDKLGKELAPLFVVPLLYCSAVDLMARVKHKGSPRGQNAILFKDSAKSFFGFTEDQAKALWGFRNSLSHQYSIREFVISRYGGSGNILDVSTDRVVASVRPMRGSLSSAIDAFHEFLRNESAADKALTAKFLEDHGFTYYLVV